VATIHVGIDAKQQRAQQQKMQQGFPQPAFQNG